MVRPKIIKTFFLVVLFIHALTCPLFGNIGCRNICLLSNFMQLDGTYLLVRNAPKKIHLTEGQRYQGLVTQDDVSCQSSFLSIRPCRRKYIH